MWLPDGSSTPLKYSRDSAHVEGTPRVRFTATANEHVDRERAWWLANRDYQDLFATELENALRVLAVLPGAGTRYPQAETAELRRLYLRKLNCHL
jgi:hypothetical protein